MKILLSNDDGYQAPGLAALAAALREVAEIVVMAPDRNRSGASNSLTLDRPVRVRREGSDAYSLNGTPTDCVHLAVTGLLDEEPDMVVSGINDGANLGDDVIYSGTVAAAMEGRFLGLPAIAISLAGHQPTHYETAAKVALDIVRRLLQEALPTDTILNVNVPDIPYAELGGLEVTRLGFRHRAEPAVREIDPRGREIYWIGAPGPEQDAGPGTDFHAVREGRVSITPLHTDLTRHAALAGIGDWLAGGQSA